ncbi:glycoside hydrolase family protein, partial [Paracoccus sp. (in: a-proteobacteria)]|uniref:glycoside hydrolase family protein n=1 Tax=Paracoccus sp. TaxID=267 RepID=UPI0028A5E839
MSNEADLLISAGFSDAKLVQEANKVLAFYRKKGEEAQKAFQDAQGRVTDTRALRAHERDMDRLGKAYDPVYRAAKRYEKAVSELDRLMAGGRINQKQYTAEVERFAREVQNAGQATETVTRKGQQMGAGWQNVGWQVGDFATQVGAGTSAVQALGQQMPQLLGGLGTMGALMGAGAAIAIPLGAALIRMASNSKTLEERMEALNKTTSAYVEAAENAAIPIEELRRKYGGLADEVARVNKLQAEVSKAAAKAALVDTSKAFAEQFGDFDQGVNKWRPGRTDYQVTLGQIRKELKLTGPEARQVARALDDISSASNETEVLRGLQALSELTVELAGDADKANEKFGKLLSGDGKKTPGLSAILKEAQKQVGAATDDAARKAQDVIKQYETDTERLKKLSEDRKAAQTLLDEAIQKGGKDAIDLARQRVALIDLEISKTRELAAANDMSFEAMAKRLKQIGIHIADTVEKRLGDARKEYAGSITPASEVIKRYEGFRSDAYWDVNAYRAGYGSDTVTLSDGSIVKITEGMSVSIEDANRDLARRIGEFQTGIIRDIGAVRWTKFEPDQQAALTSIAYNYGSLPKRILEPVRSGTNQDIANAIAALANDNEGINARRRQSEASAFGQANDLTAEIRDRERLAKQAKEYGEQLSRNLLSEERQAELAKQQADQIAAIKASGVGEADQAAAIAQVTAEIEKQRTIYTLLEEAKRRQVDLDAMLTDGSMTYRQAIEALGEAKRQQIVTDQQRAQAEQQAGERIAYAKQM